MKNRLLIIGASGHGKVVADIALKMKEWESVSFLEDNESIQSAMNIDVIGKAIDFYKYVKSCDLFVAVGNNIIREKLQANLEKAGASIPILIHPNAVIGEQVELNSGTVVMAGAVINCCTKIGKGCIINTAATIDHDSVIEDYVHISPGANLAGTVRVGKGTWLGIGSIVSNNVTITSDCKVAAGTVVVTDLTESGTYVGVPAKLKI
jgi:sugar O-acyltransferase (sialic acid O-acetyltransferase NeuD family)